MKKYLFVLANYDGSSKISGHAYTLLCVKHIFKKVTNASSCSVYKKVPAGKLSTYSNTPSITYYK